MLKFLHASELLGMCLCGVVEGRVGELAKMPILGLKP